MLNKGTLRLVDLNGRELNIPAQSIDGQLVSQDMSLVVCLAVLCSVVVAIVISLIIYKICCRMNVVAPLKIHSPKSYLYPNLFFAELSVLKKQRSDDLNGTSKRSS
jgi:hypothetical protein